MYEYALPSLKYSSSYDPTWGKVQEGYVKDIRKEFYRSLILLLSKGKGNEISDSRQRQGDI